MAGVAVALKETRILKAPIRCRFSHLNTSSATAMASSEVLVITGVRCTWAAFFFKQTTAYALVSGDWSSDVCSSDLVTTPAAPGPPADTRAVIDAVYRAESRR